VAVLFDLDNTLYAYDPAHAAGMAATRKKACALVGCTVESFEQVFAEAKRDVKAQLGSNGASHSRLLYFHRMLEILGMKSQPLLALDLEQTYWRTFLGSAKLFPDTKEFLDELRTAGVATALVTDLTTQIQFRKLIYFGLDHSFDYVVTSEEAGSEKPTAAPFVLIRRKLGDLRGTIWMIGDNGHSDIAGAREHLSAVTLQKRHAGVKLGEGTYAADAVFDEFCDVRQAFAKTRPKPT
jgi:HAD superfamily hydrolase (TIGR01549 family)